MNEYEMSTGQTAERVGLRLDPKQEENLEELEQVFGDSGRRIEYSTKIPTDQELLDGGATYIDPWASEILDKARQAQSGQPDQTVVNVAFLKIASTGTNGDVMTREYLEKSLDWKDFVDLKTGGGRKILSCLGFEGVRALIGDWKDKTVEERKEFIKAAAYNHADDMISYIGYYGGNLHEDVPPNEVTHSKDIMSIQLQCEVDSRLYNGGNFGSEAPKLHFYLFDNGAMEVRGGGAMDGRGGELFSGPGEVVNNE
ncbi:MAG: hypothetical protein LBK50_00990 [Candidatus Nomurabacteria bacterium]|jgi:hypothetical protein|nr:hypothetical protein [Candidatus Nomurabacteria bacterium]